jgi:outer membrane protein assembly factor BamB
MRIMTTRLTALAVAVLAAPLAAQAPTTTITTRAVEPAASDLSRLNLVTSWRIFLPVVDRGDGIVTVQPADDQVFVQLRSGRIIAIQANPNPRSFRRPGDVIWSYRPALPPGVVRPLGIGPTEVYVAHGQRLLILDRVDGKVKYTEEMVSTAAAGPAVDATSLYIPLSNRRIVAYSHTEKIPGYRPPKPIEYPDPVQTISLRPDPADALSTPQNRSPSIARLEILRPPFTRGSNAIDSSVSITGLKTLMPPYREVDAARSPSVGMLPHLRDVYDQSSKEAPTRVKFLWELLSGGKLDDTPVLTSDPDEPGSERLSSYTGRIVFTGMRDSPKTNVISTEYIAEADVTAPLASQGDYLYVATADSNLISLSVRELREPTMAANTLPRGKFTTGGPVEQKPLLTDDSLFVVGDRWGLIRLKRGTLEPMWNARLPDGRIRAAPNEEVERVLAVNPSYVYAVDRRGRLLVIDAVRGQTLSNLDVSEFNVPVINEVNDRLYLAGSNGLLVCLHDRSRVAPVLLRKPPPPPKKVEPPPEPKLPEFKEPPPKKEPPKKEPEKKEPPKKEPEKKEPEKKE